MKIKMKTLSIGPSGKKEIGGVYEVDEKEGKMLCDRGYAEEVDAALELEASPSEPEKKAPTKKKTAKK